MEEQKKLSYVFNEIPLYAKEEFNVLYKENDEYFYDVEEFKRFMKYIGTDNKKIITNCIWCNKEFSFNYDKTMFKLEDNEEFYNTISFYLTSDSYIQLGGSGIILHSQPPFNREELVNSNYYIIYSVSCSHDISHCYYLSLLVRVEEGKFIVSKVGQYPTMMSVKGFDFDKYKKQLKKYDAYDDYKNADLSMNETFYAGAYTYLRRVYEKQLNYYVDKDKATLADNRTETKIKAVKSNFDPRTHEHLGNLYAILSIGIHELDEEESKEYYEFLKAMIDMQLQYEKARDEENKQTKTITTKISNIVNKLNKRK